MSLFLITFLSLYGGLHLYTYIRLRTSFILKRKIAYLLAGWMVLMTLAPLATRIAESSQHARIAAMIAWPGYIWMGSIFIFCSLLLFLDSIRTIAWLYYLLTKAPIPRVLSATATCRASLILAIAASSYSLYESRTIRTELVTVTTDKLSSDVRSIRLVQISDVHIGLLFKEARLESVLKRVRAANPDIIVSTGDLVDGRLSGKEVIAELNDLADMIRTIPAPQGKYAITGNHEFYAGIDQALAFTRRAGFSILRNQSVTLRNGITISGVDDESGFPYQPYPEPGVLESVSPVNFTILLKHRPVVFETRTRHFDLQLSGHVHKGQLFPFNLLARLRYPIPCGTSTTAGGTRIHVSRGSGTWGPPMRLFAPPEVTIIDIKNNAAGS